LFQIPLSLFFAARFADFFSSCVIFSQCSKSRDVRPQCIQMSCRLDSSQLSASASFALHGLVIFSLQFCEATNVSVVFVYLRNCSLIREHILELLDCDVFLDGEVFVRELPFLTKLHRLFTVRTVRLSEYLYHTKSTTSHESPEQASVCEPAVLSSCSYSESFAQSICFGI